MDLSEIPAAIVGSDLSAGVSAFRQFGRKNSPPNKKETTSYVNRHCVFTRWKKARALNGALSLERLRQRGPLTINFSLIKLITNSS